MISRIHLGILYSLFLSQVYSLSTPLSSSSSSSSQSYPTTTTTTTTTTTNAKWKPKVSSLEGRKLQVQTHNSELIGTSGFHHIEFYCGDAKSTAYRFSLALGMPITCTTGQHTGNDQCCSYGLESGDVRFLFTAPYSRVTSGGGSSTTTQQQDSSSSDVVFDSPHPLPSFSVEDAHNFFQSHGLGAKAVGVEVKDAKKSFDAAVANGAIPVLDAQEIGVCPGMVKQDEAQQLQSSPCTVAEVELYGEVVLRFVSFATDATTTDDSKQQQKQHYNIPFLPHLTPHQMTARRRRETYGIHRIDHAVGNVPDLLKALTDISAFTGFHEFAEFTSEDVGTINSGLNSVVLASDSENVLLPLNEPTEGKRKSQIQTYLEQNEGAGLQHLALKTDNIFHTISKMKMAEEELGGFELMKRPSNEYYRELPSRLGDQLTPEQYQRTEELGILADADEEGILLQVFTKPIGDRPTFFIEIIQRIGCLYKPDGADIEDTYAERPGCGGFGKGNFKELFKSIEDHEKTLKV